jgi:hypothetical protein
MTKGNFATAVLVSGVLTLAAVLAWWWIAFAPVITSQLMTIPQAMPCLLATSDICSLAEALCKGTHFLGITRYEPAGLWTALGLISFMWVVTAKKG